MIVEKGSLLFCAFHALNLHLSILQITKTRSLILACYLVLNLQVYLRKIISCCKVWSK